MTLNLSEQPQPASDGQGIPTTSTAIRGRRVRRPNRHSIVAEVDVHAQPRPAQCPHTDQRTVELGIGQGRRILKGQATLQDNPIRQVREGGHVAHQPKVGRAHRYCRLASQGPGDDNRAGPAILIRVEAGGEQMVPPGVSLAAVARVQRPLLGKRSGRRREQTGLGQEDRQHDRPVFKWRRSGQVLPVGKGQAVDEQGHAETPATGPKR